MDKLFCETMTDAIQLCKGAAKFFGCSARVGREGSTYFVELPDGKVSEWLDITDEDEIEINDGFQISWGFYESPYDLSQLTTKTSYVDGIKHKTCTTWQENGKKSGETHYVDGKRQGLAFTWDENGHESSKTAYVHDKNHGLDSHWYGSGQKMMEVNYVAGAKHSLETHWYESGQEKMQVNYVAGAKHSLETHWYESGQKKMEVNYVVGKKHGLETHWYENGQKKSESRYVVGAAHGWSTHWYESGRKQTVSLYVDGKPDGLEAHWYENGQKKMEANYVAGKKQDLVIRCDETGKVRIDYDLGENRKPANQNFYPTQYRELEHPHANRWFHRKLDSEEQEALAERLEALDSATSATYEYPVRDLISNLRDRKKNAGNLAMEKDGEVLKYRLHFVSPPSTWEILCGVEGVYTIEAASLAALDFQITMQN